MSLDLSNKVYGTGPSAYSALTSWLDGATLEQMPAVVEASLTDPKRNFHLENLDEEDIFLL
jgi:hypothetical protein